MSRAFARMTPVQPVSREEFALLEPELRDALLHAQDDLQGCDYPVIVMLDGDDLTGCEHVFELLHAWFDARYLRAEAFGVDGEAGTATVFQQRYWRALPPRGTIGLWLRSWSRAVVTARVRGWIDDAEATRRIDHIRSSERALAADGAVLLKFWIRVPKKTLKKRLQKARDVDPRRTPGEDELALDAWDEYQDVAAGVVEGTDGPHAPWMVLDGSHNRARSVAVARAIAQVMRARLDSPRPAAAPPPPLAASPTTRSGGRRSGTGLDDDRGVLDRVEQLGPMSEEDYERDLNRGQARLSRAHREAHAERRATVLVFEGQDAAGKGGAIRRLTAAMDAPKYKVFPIGAPDARELSRHWLWRFWSRLPAPGCVSIFDRSWYGRVLVERVEGFATPDAWARAYGEIESFESQLVSAGITLVKLWLHVSAEEQLRRFEERASTSFKRYKIGPDDWRNRERAPDYEAAAAEMFDRTSGVVPWHIVPADDKHRARIQVLKRVGEAFGRRHDARVNP